MAESKTDYLSKNFAPISLEDFLKRTNDCFDRKNLVDQQILLKELVEPFSGNIKLNWVKENDFQVEPKDNIYREDEGYSVTMVSHNFTENKRMGIVCYPLYGKFVYHLGSNFGTFTLDEEGDVGEFRKDLKSYFNY